jgi:hypothetical protein
MNSTAGGERLQSDKKMNVEQILAWQKKALVHIQEMPKKGRVLLKKKEDLRDIK